MFEGMEAAGRHPGADRNWRLRTKSHPHFVVGVVEGGDGRCGRGPGRGLAPHEPRATRAEHPLVTSGNEEVAAQFRQLRAVDSEAVDSVDTKQYAVLLIATGVDGLERIGDGADRQLYAGAGVNPGHSQHSSLRSN